MIIGADSVAPQRGRSRPRGPAAGGTVEWTGLSGLSEPCDGMSTVGGKASPGLTFPALRAGRRLVVEPPVDTFGWPLFLTPRAQVGDRRGQEAEPVFQTADAPEKASRSPPDPAADVIGGVPGDCGRLDRPVDDCSGRCRGRRGVLHACALVRAHGEAGGRAGWCR
jgi:hypothetical protein